MRMRLHIAAALAALLLAGASRRAESAERVSLTNGYDLLCHHHAQVGSRIRLYMGPGEGSYIDQAPSDIAKIESVPDLPPLADSVLAPSETRAGAPLSSL